MLIAYVTHPHMLRASLFASILNSLRILFKADTAVTPLSQAPSRERDATSNTKGASLYAVLHTQHPHALQPRCSAPAVDALHAHRLRSRRAAALGLPRPHHRPARRRTPERG